MAREAHLVREAYELHKLATAALIAAVAADRFNGIRWAEVGAALGVSQSSAHNKFIKHLADLEGREHRTLENTWKEIQELVEARQEEA